MLPDIPIPRSHAREANLKRFGHGDVEPCLLCAKPVNHDTARWVALNDWCGEITDPKNEPNGGCFPVGPDCWKRNPQLKPYECGNG